MPDTIEINIDHDLAHADWPKRTPDTMEDLERGIEEEKEEARKKKTEKPTNGSTTTMSVEDWSFTIGPRGGSIWTNVRTGEVRRQKENPGGKRRKKKDDKEGTKVASNKKFISARLVNLFASTQSNKNAKRASDDTINKMSPRMIKGVAENIGGVFVFDTMNEVHKQWKILSGKTTLPDGGIAAFVSSSEGERMSMYVNGGDDGIWAHEYTHMIDYGSSFSGTEEWKKIWQEWRRNTKLADEYDDRLEDDPDADFDFDPFSDLGPSRYATTNPAEAFAEFGRIVIASPETAKAQHPTAWKFWKQAGLIQ